ncbi:MAG: hypothetical protein A2942_00185 [Candidatus Lloydbacteria bacterium RIFCSPLOWO2_01_FULL_50_20]|uniref:YqgE/AlgH family protein n=1 Tax=Candidatus Lloydbacteria bacterium RIFCSPLOWO2_01_FULL_50_20 TaxID=1798665 RepID=A0A1G2DG10_9BACT|nr:MAG: hypothetical protein A2942_00185 [Candidatus Lloydbacteria bacterium RIFCSPLOWO2_01_FULL_50_20]
MNAFRNTIVFALAIALSFAITSYAQTAPDPAQETVMLVAKPQLLHPLYGNSVLIAMPVDGGVHIGFILNKPTKVTLGDAFPDHEPSKKAASTLFLGGPVDVNMLFALVRGSESPGAGSIRFTKDIFLAIAAEMVDKIIESDPGNARFLFGSVIWRPGELEEEIKKGMWNVMEPDSGLLVKKNTSDVWGELNKKFESQPDGDLRGRGVGI